MGRSIPGRAVRACLPAAAAVAILALTGAHAAQRGAGPWVFSGFLDPGFNVIDATIVRDGACFLRFLKNETLRPKARKNLRLATADHALGPYVVRPEVISKEDWVEGPTAFRAGLDLFVLFGACARHRYEGVRSRDLEARTALGVPERVLKGLLAAGPAGAASETTNGVQRS